MGFVRFIEIEFKEDAWGDAQVEEERRVDVCFDANDVTYLEAKGDNATCVDFSAPSNIGHTCVVGSLSEVVEKIAKARSK